MNTPPAPVNLNTRPEVDGFWRRLQWALLPPHCLLCGQRGDCASDLCSACSADFVPNRSACARCALPLPAAASLCGECLQHAPAFDAAFAPFLYLHPLDLLLTKLKFGHNLAAGRALARVWRDALRDGCADGRIERLPDALIPVPLHPARLRERGYNQALELAKALAFDFDLPLAPGLLVRTRATAAQSNLDAKTRRMNLRGAFHYAAIKPSAPIRRLGHADRADAEAQIRSVAPDSPPAHVAIVDDVMTTGATLRECARTLKRAGIRRVDVWALARAPRRR